MANSRPRKFPKVLQADTSILQDFQFNIKTFASSHRNIDYSIEEVEEKACDDYFNVDDLKIERYDVVIEKSINRAVQQWENLDNKALGFGISTKKHNGNLSHFKRVTEDKPCKPGSRTLPNNENPPDARCLPAPMNRQHLP